MNIQKYVHKRVIRIKITLIYIAYFRDPRALDNKLKNVNRTYTFTQIHTKQNWVRGIRD